MPFTDQRLSDSPYIRYCVKMFVLFTSTFAFVKLQGHTILVKSDYIFVLQCNYVQTLLYYQSVFVLTEYALDIFFNIHVYYAFYFVLRVILPPSVPYIRYCVEMFVLFTSTFVFCKIARTHEFGQK